MSLLRRARAEVAGAWRSARYDLGRRPAPPSADGPHVTSTGMGTFGGVALAEPAGRARTARPPRSALLVGTLGALTVAGAAGAYFGVVNGLGTIVAESPAAADTFPTRPAATAEAGLGHGPAPRKTTRSTATKPTSPISVRTVKSSPPAATAPMDRAPAPPPAEPAKPTAKPAAKPAAKAKPAGRDCPCGPPPVPTPTAPTEAPDPTPSATPPASPPPSASPTPGEPSATPDDSAEPSRSPQARHHRRHR